MESKRIVKKILNTQKGQATIEAVLLAFVLIIGFKVATDQARQKQIIPQFTEKTTKYVKSMSTYGTWREDGCKALGGGGTAKDANCHPNSINRSLSSRED